MSFFAHRDDSNGRWSPETTKVGENLSMEGRTVEFLVQMDPRQLCDYLELERLGTRQ